MRINFYFLPLQLKNENWYAYWYALRINFTKSPVKPLPFSPSQSRHLILKNPLNRQLLKKLICKAYQFAYQFKLRTLIGEKQKLIRKLICFAYQFIHQKSNLTKFCLEIERLIWKAYQFAYQFIFQAFIAYKWKLIRLLIRFAYQFTKSPVKPLPFCPSQSRHLILKNPLNR